MPLRDRSSTNELQDYIVIGAGIAGLSAAVTLAARGHHVTIFEKNSRIGGKLNVWKKDGFTFDTGPHVLTMLFAFEELFEQAGKNINDYLELIKLETVCRYHYGQGRTLDCPADPIEAQRVLEMDFPGSGAEFSRFLAHSEDVYNKTTDTFLRQDVAEAMRLGGPVYAFRNMQRFFSVKPFISLDTLVKSYFNSEQVRQIFRLYALYSGSHPARCSSIFSTVAHVQWKLGTYYIMGGMYRLADALTKMLRDLNVTIVTDTRVTEIMRSNGRASGVKTVGPDGEHEYKADGVICNQDVLTADTLLPGEKKAPNVEPSTSAFLMLLGVKGSCPVLAHHNSFLTGDEWGEYASIFDKGVPPEDPTLGVSNQTVTDPSCAPDGMTNLFIMANVPALGSNWTWTADNIAAYRQVILKKLERMGLERLSERITVEQIWTPQDIVDRYGSARGAIYGLSSNGFRQAFMRPGQKNARIRSLYYAGGSTHPGGGMPLCILSGKIAAEQILKS